MTTFRSLPQAIHLDFELSELFSDVTGLINGLGLADALSDAQQEIDKVKADLAQLKQIIDALGDINEQDKWYEKVNASFTVLDKVLVLLQNTSTAQYQAVVNSSEYKALIAFRKEWDVWAKPIGNQTESINETLEFDESKDSGNLLDHYKDAEFSIGLSVEGSAGFNLATFDKTDAKEATGFDIADGHTIVNQEVSAVIEATVNAAGSYQALTLSASANGKAKVEVDSFYQAASSTPTFEVLYNMYKKPLLPWSLANIADVMALSEGDSAGAGYRGLSMIREASFGFEGEIGVGRSINSISNIDNQPIEIDVSAALSLSGKMTIDGKMELFTKRNKQNEIVLSVNTLDNQFKGKAVKLDIGTKIKGLDKVVQPQIERLIGKGNEVLKLLEREFRSWQTIS